jgi:hypothetical protein
MIAKFFRSFFRPSRRPTTTEIKWNIGKDLEEAEYIYGLTF